MAAVAANLEFEAALIGQDPLLICDIKRKKQNLQARHTPYIIQLSLNSFVHFPRRRKIRKGEEPRKELIRGHRVVRSIEVKSRMRRRNILSLKLRY